MNTASPKAAGWEAFRYRFKMLGLSVSALVLGLGFYLVARPATVITSLLGVDLVTSPSPHLPLSGNLPSLLLGISLTLLAFALLPRYRQLAVMWSALACSIVELAQLPVPFGASTWQPLPGTFDPGDMAAGISGIALATLIARLMGPRAIMSGSCPTRSPYPALYLLVGVALVLGTATTPRNGPPGFVESDVANLCPGSSLTLRWFVSDSEGKELFLVASNPEVVTPSITREPVSFDGSMVVQINDEVEFHLESASGEVVHGTMFVAPLISAEGVNLDIEVSPRCIGGKVFWEHSYLSPWYVDMTATVSRVSASGDNTAPISVSRVGVEAVLAPGEVTNAFNGQVAMGTWLAAIENVSDDVCTLYPGERPFASIRVTAACPDD